MEEIRTCLVKQEDNSLVTWALPSFEGIESGKNYEKKGEEEANHDFILNTRTYKDLLGSLQGKDH